MLTTSTPGAQASTHPPKLVNHALSPWPSAPTPTMSSQAAGKYGRAVAWLPAAAMPMPRSPSSAIERGAEQLAVVVAHVAAEAEHDDVERLLRGAQDVLERGDHRGHVTVAEARQGAADVDLGVGADLLDDPRDERAVAGLEVDRPAAVVVVLVLVVDGADGRIALHGECVRAHVSTGCSAIS